MGDSSMLKVWEVCRKVKAKVVLDELLTQARAKIRKVDERALPAFKDLFDDKVVGYISIYDALIPTSHHTTIRVKDVLREHPLIPANYELADAFSEMLKFNAWQVPVIESVDNPKYVGMISFRDMIKALQSAGYAPRASTVSEIMSDEDLDKMIVTPDTRVNKVWSKLVYRGLPCVIVVRDEEAKIPVGIVTPRDMVKTSRWFFHREAEEISVPAKVSRIMVRGVVVATPDTPINVVAEFMVNNDFSVIPVIDEEKGSVIGYVTQADVVRAYLEGRKPGRVVVKPAVTPKPMAIEERAVYVPHGHALQQVLVAKPQVEALVGLRAADVMRTELPAISVNDTVEHARKEMIRRKTNYLLVIDENGGIVGVVSKRNMLRALGLKGPIWKRRVHDRLFIDYVMTKDIPEVSEDEPIENVALAIMRSDAELAIVRGKDGSVKGFVTKDDIVDAYLKTCGGRALVENIMTPGKMGIVHPHHSLYHVVTKMRALFLDAVTVYDGAKVLGVVSENRLPFVAFEDAVTGIRSRKLIWVRKLVRGAARKGRYVKIMPLMAIDVTVPLKEYVRPDEDVIKAILLMKKYNVDGVPVITADGEVLGVVCKNDIIRELARTAMLKEKEEGKPEVKVKAK